MMFAHTVEIYGLVDPRDQRVRYVGKAANSDERLGEHLRDAKHKNRPLHLWIRELAAINLRPTLEILCLCDAVGWEKYERTIIAQYRAFDSDLLNVANGGNAPKPGPPNIMVLARLFESNVRTHQKRGASPQELELAIYIRDKFREIVAHKRRMGRIEQFNQDLLRSPIIARYCGEA